MYPPGTKERGTISSTHPDPILQVRGSLLRRGNIHEDVRTGDNPIPVAGVDHVLHMKRRDTGKRENAITPNLLAKRKGSVGGEVLGHGLGPQVILLLGPVSQMRARERDGLRREDYKQKR